MDLESYYKKVKEESNNLVMREKALKARIEEVKKLKALNENRKKNIADLEKELENYFNHQI